MPRYTQHGFDFLEMAFDQLVVPACKECNSEFSKLETQTKRIVVALLKYEKLSPTDLDVLLGWFDKVRLGLRHLQRFHDKAIFPGGGSFPIKNLRDAADRALLIFRTEGEHQSLRFWGGQTPMFQWMPSCFVMTINSFCFVNIAKDCLLSRNLGFPFVDMMVGGNGGCLGVLQPGLHKVSRPILPFLTLERCLAIWQVMRIRPMNPNPHIDAVYETPFVQSRWLRKGASIPLVEEYPNGNDYASTMILKPPVVEKSLDHLFISLCRQAFDIQYALWNQEMPLLTGDARSNYHVRRNIIEGFYRETCRDFDSKISSAI